MSEKKLTKGQILAIIHPFIGNVILDPKGSLEEDYDRLAKEKGWLKDLETVPTDEEIRELYYVTRKIVEDIVFADGAMVTGEKPFCEMASLGWTFKLDDGNHDLSECPHLFYDYHRKECKYPYAEECRASCPWALE